MNGSSIYRWTFVIIVLSVSGCAHVQLRWNTTHQARTLTDIYEQQVLDNLAMFVSDPNALPSFAYPNAGGSDVTDNAALGSDTTWTRLGFSQEVLKPTGGRGMKEAWTLQPVYDVRRLELMRCAYQRALYAAGLCGCTGGCPNCDKLQRAFYLGDPEATYNDGNPEYPDHLITFSMKTGRTTPACFQQGGWLACGPHKCVPKRCLKKGHYCNTDVWILPGGQDELTKLTLTILDYAFSPQATKSVRTKEVTWYFDKNGNPVERDNAAQEMTAVLPLTAKARLNTAGADLPADDATGLKNELNKRRIEIDQVFENNQGPSYQLPPILPPPNWNSPLQYELNRDFLTPRESPSAF